MKQPTTIKITLAWFLLGFWSLIMLNSVMYRHSHRLPDGKIVSHAHPYKKGSDSTPAQPHEHTDEELALLQLIDGQLFEPPSMIAAVFIVPQSTASDKTFFYSFSFSSFCIFHRAGRAPPRVLPV